MAPPPNVAKLITLNRFQNGLSLVPLVLYLPAGIVLTFIRCFIFLHALLVYCFLSKISFIQNVLLRVMFAVCGLVVTTDGDSQTNHNGLVLVANHMTSLDPFILSLILRFILVMEPSSCPGDLTHLCRQVSVPGHLGKEEGIQCVKKAAEASGLPLLMFPESRRANSSFGLLKFRVLPFQLDARIQQIGIIGRRWFFNINISTFNSPWWLDLLICFFIPFTIFTIKYLPLTEQRESETSEQFSERVQSNLAKGLGVAATNITLSDVKEFLKNGRQSTQPAASTPTAASVSHTGEESASSQSRETKSERVEVTSSDPALNVMLKQVKEVLPHASSQAVLRDLEKTRDVDLTITNILEGHVDVQQDDTPPQPTSAQKETDASTFKAASFPKSASARHMSLSERKQAMLETARKRYREKYGVP